MLFENVSHLAKQVLPTFQLREHRLKYYLKGGICCKSDEFAFYSYSAISSAAISYENHGCLNVEKIWWFWLRPVEQ